MGTILLYAFGYHEAGGFDHTGFALFTNAHRSVLWTRANGKPLLGDTYVSDSGEQTMAYQKTLREILAEFRATDFSKTIIRPLRVEAFGFNGEELSDFSDHLLMPKFINFSRYIGMPGGMVEEAARQLLFTNRSEW